MSQKALLQSVIEYLIKQKSYGRKVVRRTSIYDVMEDRYGVKTIANGKALTRGLLSDAALAAGGVYFPAKNGNSKVIFS